MKVYIVIRYWDNDEKYPEDFMKHEEPVKVFKSLEATANYLNTLTVDDILGSECKGEDGWYLDESEEIKEDKFGCKHRSFHTRTPLPEWWESDDSERYEDHDDEDAFYESANIIFSVLEMEVEE